MPPVTGFAVYTDRHSSPPVDVSRPPSFAPPFALSVSHSSLVPRALSAATTRTLSLAHSLHLRPVHIYINTNTRAYYTRTHKRTLTLSGSLRLGGVSSFTRDCRALRRATDFLYLERISDSATVGSSSVTHPFPPLVSPARRRNLVPDSRETGKKKQIITIMV